MAALADNNAIAVAAVREHQQSIDDKIATYAN